MAAESTDLPLLFLRWLGFVIAYFHFKVSNNIWAIWMWNLPSKKSNVRPKPLGNNDEAYRFGSDGEKKVEHYETLKVFY